MNMQVRLNNKMDTLAKRLKFAREKRKLTQEQLSELSGVAQSDISKYERGKSLKTTNLVSLAKALDCNPEWLDTGDGNIWGFTKAKDLESVSVPQARFKRVWVVGKAAGGVMPERLWTDGDHPVGATDEYGELASADPHAFLVNITGTSMVPRYNPGEFALVEPGTDPEVEDDVLVRCQDGKTMLKRLLSKRGGYMLGSWNNTEIIHLQKDEVVWMYYVAHPVPRRKIKIRTF